MKAYGQLAGFLVAIATLIWACEKKEAPEEFRPSRVFAPTGLVVTAPNTHVDITWSAPLYSLPSDGFSYTIQVSTDNSFQAIVREVKTELQTVRFDNTQLTPDVPYVARVKAEASATGQAASNWSVTPLPFTVTP